MKKSPNDRWYLALAKRNALPPEVKAAYKAAKKLQKERKAAAQAAWKAKRRQSHARKGGSVVASSPTAPPLVGPTVDASSREPLERI